MSFIKTINYIIDEALISKKEIKADPEMIQTLADSFDLNKYKGVRKNILRPLFKKIAETYGVPLQNNGKTIIFDFNNLMVEKEITLSRQLNISEKTLLSNLLFRYGYVFDETLFLVGNAKKRNGHLESLINIFDKISEELQSYQKHQNEKDKNLIKIKKIKEYLDKVKEDKKFLNKNESEKEAILISKNNSLKSLEEKNILIEKKLDDLKKDEEVFSKLQDKIYKYKDINYKILITYIPWRIAAMSTFSSHNPPWDSCMNLEHGSNNHYVGSSISNGAFVAYLIRPGDEKNIENPIARVLIKPFLRISDNIVKYDYEDDYEEDEEEDENNKYDRYAEIDYLDKNKLETDVYWYVDLVYPRGQYGSFRSKVVSIFNKINTNVKKGDFIISKGQYADSKSKVNIDDIFTYVNNGDYSDISTKDTIFISKMIKEYPFEFFSNWPEKESMPENLIIHSNIELENMDIRKLPDGLVINGNLTINNINIKKLNNIKCKKMEIKNNNNLISIENCEMDILHIKNNKKLLNIDINNKYKHLNIVDCKKINKLDNLNLKTLKIQKKEKNEPFVFGKNLKIENELTLDNFKIEDNYFFKNIKILELSNVEMRSLSGDYENVYIKSNCEIETIENLKVKYALELNNAKIKTLNDIRVESTFSLNNENIKTIKNLHMTQKYEHPTSRYVGCSIGCKKIEEIENISAEYFLSFFYLENIKIINNINCDSDVIFKYCNFNNFNNLNNFKIKCKKIFFEASKIKTIKNLKINSIDIIESEVDEISDINCEKELEIKKTKTNIIKNIKSKEKIFFNDLKISNISQIESENIVFNKVNGETIVDLSNNEIEKITMYNSSIKELRNGIINSLTTTDYSFIDKIENLHVKKQLKVFGSNVTEIGRNVIFGTDSEKNNYKINFIDYEKISKDFKIIGNASWINNDMEVLPFITVKGKLVVYSDKIKDATENSEIDELDLFGDKRFFRDDIDKDKILSKIKTLKT